MKTKRPRGAPHGNRNAMKHGFYSSVFKANERRILSQLPLTDLAGEIELIRVANYRFLEALNASTAPLDVETQLAALRAVNLSAQSITSLIRAQVLAHLTDGNSKLSTFLNHLEAPDPAPAASPSSLPPPHAPPPLPMPLFPLSSFLHFPPRCLPISLAKSLFLLSSFVMLRLPLL